jgi:hypothetical protein
MEHEFQDTFKNGISTGKDAYMQTGTILRVMLASRPKISFDQMAAPVPEIMDSNMTSIFCTYLPKWNKFEDSHSYFRIG